MARKCSSLKENEIVVFEVKSTIIEGKNAVYDGNVIYVDNEQRIVAVCYLEGFRSRTADIPFEKMKAVYNPKGEEMWFDNIHGPSDLLTAE